MRALIQRVRGCTVWIDGGRHAEMAKNRDGLLVLLGARNGDRVESAKYLSDKILNLRIFEDSESKMNLSVLDIKGEIMVVSQFTLYAETAKGRRPSFTEAMEPTQAERLYEEFTDLLRKSSLKISSGVFGAKMDVALTNNGPVTILLEHPV